MNTGQLNKSLTFYPVTQSRDTNGDYAATYGTGVAIRGKLTQLSGYRKMVYTELVNAQVYEFECFDNAAITKDSKVVYGSITLYVHEMLTTDDKSFTSTKELILYTK